MVDISYMVTSLKGVCLKGICMLYSVPGLSQLWATHFCECGRTTTLMTQTWNSMKINQLSLPLQAKKALLSIDKTLCINWVLAKQTFNLKQQACVEWISYTLYKQAWTKRE